MDPGIEYISNGLKQSTLHDLNISYCGLDSNGAHLIADALCYNHTLMELDMSGNLIGDDGATILAEMLTRNQSLSELDIRHCSISGVGASHLARALLANHSITRIELAGNDLTTPTHDNMSIDPRLHFHY